MHIPQIQLAFALHVCMGWGGGEGQAEGEEETGEWVKKDDFTYHRGGASEPNLIKGESHRPLLGSAGIDPRSGVSGTRPLLASSLCWREDLGTLTLQLQASS